LRFSDQLTSKIHKHILADKRQSVAEESPNIMAVWGTPDECIQKISYYVDSIRPEQLMLNIASGSLS
jgi:hypothetical protein